MPTNNLNILQIMNDNISTPKSRSPWLAAAGLLMIASTYQISLAYEQYTDPDGGCVTCHGDFRGNTSTKGTIFPNNKNHDMHRDSAYMATVCNLCHTGDSNTRKPVYIGSSNGTNGVPGLGCTGCHVASGLRAHHNINGVSECYDCHDPETAPPENVKPPYYGTAYTKVANPCNGIAAANTNENWSVGDFLGLDNDGNNLYDMADFACGPYQIVQVAREGGNIRVTWQTAGGRKDVIQASPIVSGTYTNVSSTLTNPGTGILTTNYLEAGGANKGPTRFYRVMYVP